MPQIRNTLLEPKGQVELTLNFNEILDKVNAALGLGYFLGKMPMTVINYPEAVYYYHDDEDIPVETGDETFAITKYTTNTNYDVTIALGGTAKKLSTATKTALFGAEADQTHAVVMLLQLPSAVAADIKYGSSVLEAGDIVVIEGVPYLAHVQGLYDVSGTVTTATTNFTLTYNGATYKVLWDVTGIELEA